MAVDRFPRFNVMKSLLQMSEVYPPNEERLFFIYIEKRRINRKCHIDYGF